MMPPEQDRHELLRRFYRLIDEKRWERVTAMLTGECRWHILANEVVQSASVVGPGAVSQWFSENLEGVETRQDIRRIEDEGSASVVFTEATVTSAGGKSCSTWVDVFRFDGSMIAEHVSLQSG